MTIIFTLKVLKWFRRALEKRPSSLEAWRLLAEVSGMVGDYANMENAIVDANNIYDKIIAKSVEDGIMVSRKAAAAIYHQLATSFMAVRYFEISENITNSYVFYFEIFMVYRWN